MKLYQGRFLQSLSVGAVLQRNYAKTPRDNDYGWKSSAQWASAIPKTNVTFHVEGAYRQIARDPNDTAADLKRELEAKASISVPIWGNLRLSPFVDFYQFKGQLNQPTGKNVIFGFSLDFSHLWKPSF
ncbi:hypothetical protein ACFL6Y_10920 [Elusimicrobiota bacterium]